MAKRPTDDAGTLIPDRPTIDKVRAAAKECRACGLWRRATQTVFGEGARKAELMLIVKPQAIVCLGATAAQALLGRQFKVTADRGRFITSPLAPLVLATVHPSSILRAPDEESRREELKRFTADLRKVARAL